MQLYRGRPAEAETLYRTALALRLGAFGRDDPRVSYSLRSLGALDYSRGDFAAAEPLLREALRVRLAAYGPESTDLAPVLDLLGNVRLARGDPAEAETLYRRALELRRRRLGDGHVEASPAASATWRSCGWARAGRVEARELAEKALARLQRAALPGDWRIADAESVLGAVLAAEGRRREAGPLLRESYRTLASTRGGYATATREAWQRLSAFEAPAFTSPAAPPRPR